MMYKKAKFVPTRHISPEAAVRQQVKEEIGTTKLKEQDEVMLKRKYGVLELQLTAYEQNTIRREEQLAREAAIAAGLLEEETYDRAA